MAKILNEMILNCKIRNKILNWRIIKNQFQVHVHVDYKIFSNNFRFFFSNESLGNF